MMMNRQIEPLRRSQCTEHLAAPFLAGHLSLLTTQGGRALLMPTGSGGSKASDGALTFLLRLPCNSEVTRVVGQTKQESSMRPQTFGPAAQA